ncbi:MAG TPA: ABC transporter ATP-binding protein, partial [Actinoplanes sp.]|nr:ABC transporter ATP-binding protein [Actinoplanes sp.]
PSVRPPEQGVRNLPRPGHLDISGATFAYAGAQEAVLRDVSLIARPGETTAVIGSTGSGKSTLLGLVTRQYDVVAGQVEVGGVEVADLSTAALAQSVGFVPQTPFLFAGTVRSNLQFGGADVSDDDLWRALDIAQASDFVSELDGGLDAAVTAGGRNLSGGQRQRLAIARVLVRPRDIYLFDDSFSALDHRTEARLWEALTEVVGHAAIVIVAQRISAVRNADRIVVLDGGRVVGSGRHEELMVNTPVYQQIAGSQLIEESA